MQYLITFVTITLLIQWCQIYNVLTDPFHAARSQEKFEKRGVGLLLFLTLIIANDFIAIFIEVHLYRVLIGVILYTITICLLAAYIYLWVLFIKLMKGNEPYNFIRNQVHTFFAFFILMQISRLIIQGIQQIIFVKNEG